MIYVVLYFTFLAILLMAFTTEVARDMYYKLKDELTMEEQINLELKQAIKDGDSGRKTALRSILSELKKSGQELTEQESYDVLFKLAKRYNDSIEQYKKGGRDDLVKEEEYELSVVQEFLPEQMSEEEIEGVIDEVINDVQASTMKDMGNVMKEVQNRIGNKADKKVIGEIAKSKLQ